MDMLRAIAGFFLGTGSLICIWFGCSNGSPEILAAGTGLLGTMAGFFIGEANGRKSQE